MWFITHILQGSFTDTGAIVYDCPSVSEGTLKDMGKINLSQTTTKHKKA